MASKKISETSRKFYNREKGDRFSRSKNQVVDQVNSGQRNEIRKSQMEQSRENIPEQIYVPEKPIFQCNQFECPTPYQNYQKE